MARLKQQNPQNYKTSAEIHADFENIVRYINVAGLGNKTIGELLNIMFDEDGEFDGPIELRLDSTEGLQYRVGIYSQTEDGWLDLATIASIRGTAGKSVGVIEGPFFFNRQDLTASANQTVFSYTHDAIVTDFLVSVNGILQNDTGVYTSSASNNNVTFSSGLSANDVVTILSIRDQSVTNYLRSDLIAVGAQSVFAFVHTNDEKLLVWLNGILQQEGGGNDYTTSYSANTITFVSATSNNDLITIMTVDNSATLNVAGLMLEDEYTTAGLILYSKLSIANNDIVQAKVVGLVTALGEAAKMTISNNTPSGPASGDLWLDTSQTPNLLKFYDGTAFLLTSPASSLPTFQASNASEYVRVNGAGTALEYGDINFSTMVPKTYISAANGVASLDSSGLLPILELPEIFAVDTKAGQVVGSVSNGDIFVTKIWRQKDRYDGLSAVLSAGTCTIQIKVDGSVVGSSYAVSTSVADITFGTIIEIDGTTSARLIELVVTNASSAVDLDWALSTATAAI